MLSYRHGFHAGNPADVFKHTVLVALVRAMQQKNKGILFVDTHAGPALYDLADEYALKKREFERGIGQAWASTADKPPLADCRDDYCGDYLDQVRAVNPGPELRFYPGSPLLIANLLRHQDRLVLCELHTTEQAVLAERFASRRGVMVHAGDGYRALETYLPPVTGRGLVLIDPSFELRNEITVMSAALERALRRFGHGVYTIWYPVIEGRDTLPDALPQSLGLSEEQWLDLRIEFPEQQRLGRMSGCGMAVINCPFRARQDLVELHRHWHSRASEQL
ncbi:MAG: 23S rRNA (adenine(2030)-N(6))-methyltransferase RlmJ [Wenzhouxiangellaceae bacterium]|nr:23S rRNA (adenine(2030)-N(6))-methyltransferase RlmJ [Wenzhouxiangellaceae bacterium]